MNNILCLGLLSKHILHYFGGSGRLPVHDENQLSPVEYLLRRVVVVATARKNASRLCRAVFRYTGRKVNRLELTRLLRDSEHLQVAPTLR